MHTSPEERFSIYAFPLTRLGTLAPSRHNTQPWQFSIHENTIRIEPDFARRLPVSDPENRDIYLSMGCVAENIVIAAEYYGLSTGFEHILNADDDSVLIHLIPSKSEPARAELISGMTIRQCNRRPFAGVRIDYGELRKLMAASTQPGVEFGLIDEPAKIKAVAEVMQAGRKDVSRTDSMTAELALWTRFNRREAQCKRDGLLLTEMGFPPMPGCIGRKIVSILVGKDRQRERSASFVRSSSALMYFAPEKEDSTHWFNVGRSFQRVVLTAASLRIRYAHLQLPYSSTYNPGDLALCLGCGPKQRLFVVRLGYSDTCQHSPRRPLCRMLRPNGGIIPSS